MELTQILVLPAVKGIGCFLGSFVILGIIGAGVLFFEQLKEQLLEMEVEMSETGEKIAFGTLGLIGLFLLIISISLFLKGMGLCFLTGELPTIQIPMWLIGSMPMLIFMGILFALFVKGIKDGFL